VADLREVHVAGDFTREDLDAISALVKREDRLPLLSIERHGDEVRAMTGSVCGELCGGGNMLILRKVSGRWTVIDRGTWIS